MFSYTSCMLNFALTSFVTSHTKAMHSLRLHCKRVFKSPIIRLSPRPSVDNPRISCGVRTVVWLKWDLRSLVFTVLHKRGFTLQLYTSCQCGIVAHNLAFEHQNIVIILLRVTAAVRPVQLTINTVYFPRINVIGNAILQDPGIRLLRTTLPNVTITKLSVLLLSRYLFCIIISIYYDILRHLLLWLIDFAISWQSALFIIFTDIRRYWTGKHMTSKKN